MKIIQCTQGEADWYQAKLGIPSSSEFDKIITMTGKLSTQAETYSNKLIAEMMLERPIQTFEKTPWMLRGSEMEQDAIAAYEGYKEVDTQPVGFITNDAGTLGCSPDRLIGTEGALEVKVPAEHTHVKYLLDPQELVKEYHTQNQGQYNIGGFKYVDLMSWHPEMNPVIVTVKRLPDYQILMSAALKQFCIDLETKRQRMITLGHMRKK